jgi:DMSO reductase anchor subunit
MKITNAKRFRNFMKALGLIAWLIVAIRSWTGESPVLDLDSCLLTFSAIIGTWLFFTSRSL